MPPVNKDAQSIPMAPSKSAKSSLESCVEVSSEISDITTSTQQMSNPEKNSIVGSLPAELISNIMGHFGPIFGAVFGLTCHQVHDEYKRQYPHSDTLLLESLLWDKTSKEDVQHPLFRPFARLHELLGEWMGSGDTTKYIYFRNISLGSSDLLMYCTMPGFYIGKFLLRDVYGEEADPSGHALKQLLVAWCAYIHIHRGWLQFCGDDKPPHYPCPLNMGGKAWIDEMNSIMNVYKNKKPEDIFIYIINTGINVANEEYGQEWSVTEARRKQLREH